MYTLLPWLWHLLGAEPAGRKSGIVWSPSVFSRRFRGSCRNPDEVHGTLTARRQFPIRFSVGTDPDKKTSTLPRDRPTGKDKGQSFAAQKETRSRTARASSLNPPSSPPTRICSSSPHWQPAGHRLIRTDVRYHSAHPVARSGSACYR